MANRHDVACPGERRLRSPGAPRARRSVGTSLALEFMRFVEDQPDQSVDALLEKVLRKCRLLLGAEAGTIFLTEDRSDGGLRVRPMCLQNDVVDVSKVHLDLAVDRESIVGYVAATGRTVFVRDSYALASRRPYRFNHTIDEMTGYRTVSVLAFPLRTFNEAVIGVVQLINRRRPGVAAPVAFERWQAELIEPVNRFIGRAIQRTVLIDEIRAANAALARSNRALAAELKSLREAEGVLEKAVVTAREASRAKNDFLANMSHELRTPLNSILGFAQLIAGEFFGPVGSARYVQYARDILDSGNHLKAIIDDILDLAKIEAGKTTLREERLDLAAVLADAVRIMRPQAEIAGLELKTRLDRAPTGLVADERMIKQILINLLSNAVKFTPRGGTVEVAAGLDADEGCYIRVSDTGIGMAEESIPTALAPFGQVASVYSRSAGGTGLGLPLVRSIARLHGGEIDIKSRVGIGTDVTVHFPPGRIARPD
ncbi:MAG: GAF domain-containing protein [Rhodospirillaceae bacterium]|nr:GAF domain-containing protein [Rhodospirillaceae bacterium]